MELNEEIVAVPCGDEMVIYVPSTGTAVALPPWAVEVFASWQQEAKPAAAAPLSWPDPSAFARLVAELVKHGVLIARDSLTRRELLKTAMAGSALLAAVSVPTPAQAQSSCPDLAGLTVTTSPNPTAACAVCASGQTACFIPAFATDCRVTPPSPPSGATSLNAGGACVGCAVRFYVCVNGDPTACVTAPYTEAFTGANPCP